MKEQLKLKGWVKVVITIIILGVIFNLYNKVMHTGASINFSATYWLVIVPLSFISLYFVWEA